MSNLEQQIVDWIDENYPDAELLLADSFSEAFKGVAVQFNKPVTVYDRQKCIKILMRDMSEDEAYEYFEFNVIGAYVGEATPAFMEFFSPVTKEQALSQYDRIKINSSNSDNHNYCYFTPDGSFGQTKGMYISDVSKWDEDDWELIENTQDEDKPKVAKQLSEKYMR